MDFVADGHRLNEFLRQMNDEVLSKYDTITVGEMPGATPDDAIKFTGLNSLELNMVFQFEHVALSPNPDVRMGKWNDEPVKLVELKQSLNRWQTSLDGKGWNSLYWNNHDQPRAVSRFGNDSNEFRDVSAKMLATTLHMMQGTPYIYEGEELGMTNGHFTKLEQYEDIESINFYDELVNQKHIVDSELMLKYLTIMSRDNARTPMQWNEEINAGFSTATPWYAPNNNYTEINAEKSLSDKTSVFYHYQKLIQLRHDSEIIRYGTFEPIDFDDDQVYAYRRHYEGQTILVLSNFTDKTITRDYQQLDADELLISNYTDDQGKTLRPYESKVYLFKK